jgi:hypothetical protein
MIWDLAMREGQKCSAAEENIDINISRPTLSKRKSKQSQKNILMKQKFSKFRPITLKSRYCEKGALFRCSNRVRFNKTI